MSQRSGIARVAIGVVVVIIIVILVAAAYFALSQTTTTSTTSLTSVSSTSSSSPISSSSSVISSASSSTAGSVSQGSWPGQKNNVSFFYAAGLSIPDPAISTDTSGGQIGLNMYDGILAYDGNNPPGLSPGLASSWTSSSDGLHYTFILRQSTFHDGTPVTAADVVYSSDRVMAILQGFSYLWVGVLKPGDVKALNNSAVEFNLEKPYSSFLTTMPFMFVLNSKLVMANTQSSGSYGSNGDYGTTWFTQGHDAGSGPYTLTQWVQGVSYTFNAYLNYWRGWKQNQIFGETLYANNAETTVKVRFQQTPGAFAGEFLSAEFYKTIANTSGFAITGPSRPGNAFFVLTNDAVAPLNNAHFRRALAYLFNYTDFEKNVRANGLFHDAPLAWGMLPSVYPGFSSNVPHPVYANISAAKAELSASGINPSGLRALTCGAIDGSELSRLICFQLGANAKLIGITINEQDLNFATYQGQFGGNGSSLVDMATIGEFVDYPDPGALLFPTFHSVPSNASHTVAINPDYFANATLDKLLDDARTATNSSQALQDYMSAQLILAQQMPAIPIMEQGVVVPHDAHAQFTYSFELLWERIYYWTWNPNA